MRERCAVCGESADPRWYVARPACDGHGEAFPEEILSLRARIAELEAGLAVVKQINAHIRRERDGEYDRAEENAALVNEQRDRAEGLQRSLDDHLESESAETMRAGRALARAEKAEAERDWIAKSRDTHLERAVEMETQRNALRAERDRYRDAIVEMYRANLMIDAARYHDSLVALRRIAEEAK